MADARWTAPWRRGRFLSVGSRIDKRQQGCMTRASGTTNAEAFLDRAYPRMLRVSLVLAVAGSIAAAAIFGAAAVAGFALGSAVAILNFIWLHHAVEALIGRMLRPPVVSSRLRVALAYLGRYGLVLI